MQIQLASPHDIKLTRQCHPRDVEYQKARLLKEGQIEPTVVRVITEPGEPRMYEIDLDHDEAFHLSNEQIKAAQELNWPSVQVTF